MSAASTPSPRPIATLRRWSIAGASAVLETRGDVAAVAERLDLRLAAAAEGDAVAHLERLPVRHRHRDAAGHPVGAVGRDGDRFRQIRLDRYAVDFVTQLARRAALDHLHQGEAHARVVAALDHVPHLL